MSSEQFNEDNPLGGYFRSNIIELNGTKYEDVTRGEARKVSIMKDAYTVVVIDEDYEINVISYEEL